VKDLTIKGIHAAKLVLKACFGMFLAGFLASERHISRVSANISRYALAPLMMSNDIFKIIK